MSVDLATRSSSSRMRRLTAREDVASPSSSWVSGLIFLMVATAFVVLGGSAQEPGDAEARLGLAATEGFGPYAQVMGGWDPFLAPGRVLVSQVWYALFGQSALAAVRLPDVLAAILIALLVMRRASKQMSETAGTFTALAMLASFAMVDRSSTTGIDWVPGLVVVAAFDRLFTRGSDWISGVLAALALMLGGWPCLATILLPVILLGRAPGILSKKLVIPPLLAFVAWSIWALRAERVELWASWLTLPLTQSAQWFLGLSVLTIGLPFSPLVFLAASPSLRNQWSSNTKRELGLWTQVAVIALLAGTLIPGLAKSCGLLILIAMALIAGTVMDLAWKNALPKLSKRLLLGLSFVVSMLGAIALVGFGAYLASAQPYYRIAGFVLFILGSIAGLLGVDAVWTGFSRQAVRAFILLAVGMKIAHAAIYVPEASYRLGQGPWGRAIGQHVPPKWPIYVFHAWNPDLAMAIEHPIRQLPQEVQLKAQAGTVKFVLLLEEEFKHWPEVAPPIVKVRDFQDDHGRVRVLARTPGRLIRKTSDD